MAAEPAQLTLCYKVDVSELSRSSRDSLYIDLARDLSKVNRRLYRQGMVYYVQEVTVVANPDDPDSAKFRFGTLPNTWMTHNAWKKGFELWKEQNALVLDRSPSLKPRWHDFKIFIDEPMADNILPHYGTSYVDAACDLLEVIDMDDQTYANGDWDYSKFVFDNDTIDGGAVTGDLYIWMLGTNETSDAIKGVCLLQGYAETRMMPQVTPTTPGNADESWVTAVGPGEDEAEDILEVLDDYGNDGPPYSLTLMPGQVNNGPSCALVGTIGIGDANGSTNKLGGFPVPCGLMDIHYDDIGSGDDTVDYYMFVKLLPGDYRGVAATPMGQ